VIIRAGDRRREKGRGGKGMGCSPGSSDPPGCRGARIVSAYGAC